MDVCVLFVVCCVSVSGRLADPRTGSICDAKLTDKEIDSADKSKSAAICFKCSGPLGNMQTAFDQLMKSVQ